MIESNIRSIRSRDAQIARDTILNAAESIFAQNGFHGARIDTIVKASGYNNSLLFQYFKDKLGLYIAVLTRTDKELNALLSNVIAPWLSDGRNICNTQALRDFLKEIIRTTFDYLIEHPMFMRILNWEMADGWKIYMQISSQFSADESEHIKALFHSAYKTGLMRSDFCPEIQLILILHLCQSFCASLPLYQMYAGEDVTSASSIARAREYIVSFVLDGMISNSIK